MKGIQILNTHYDDLQRFCQGNLWSISTAAAAVTTFSFCLAGLFFQILLQAMPSPAKVFKGKTLSK